MNLDENQIENEIDGKVKAKIFENFMSRNVLNQEAQYDDQELSY